MEWTSENTQGFWGLVYLFCLYCLRKQKPFDMIWDMVKYFIIITLIICSVGMAAGAIKKFFK
jgi:hypothetical protein